MRVLLRLFLVDLAFKHDELIDESFPFLGLHEHSSWVLREFRVHVCNLLKFLPPLPN